MRRAARVDENHPEIVGALRRMGFTVKSLASMGEDIPDLLCGRGGLNYLIEVKDGSKPPSRRRLSDGQTEWHDSWRGQVVVIESIGQLVHWANGLAKGEAP